MTIKSEDIGVTQHDKIKAIRTDIHVHTFQVLQALEKDFNTYTMVEVEDNTLKFIFRPDPDEPGELIDVFIIQIDPRDDTWMITTIGGDYRPKVLFQLAELANCLNNNNVKSLQTWYN